MTDDLGRVPAEPGWSASPEPVPVSARAGDHPSRSGESLLRCLTLCKLSLCETFKTASDENGIWGECQKCSRSVGYVDRAGLREIGQREFERHWEKTHG